ncbi:hypothetical protein PLESTB_001451200 [Pleodorina starrii]|uniref:Inosine/uridine-preferring nucleoside hydrolase domain-containing protein n=1 Tax=Pleodorina starrii TaxID=330485 RepID=A0A9W6F7A4_9CHLO|nr:hypothetical protein PLESTB_001451200 [Pleodorina starrii]
MHSQWLRSGSLLRRLRVKHASWKDCRPVARTFCLRPDPRAMPAVDSMARARHADANNADASHGIGTQHDAPKTRLWIDTDAGVDDALAIALALGQPSVELTGISVVRGNVGVAQGLVSVARVLLATAAADSAPTAGPAAVAAADIHVSSGDQPQPQPQPPSPPRTEPPKAATAQPQPQPQPQPGPGPPRSRCRSIETLTDARHDLPPATFLVGGVPVYAGADAPLVAPCQPLTYYYGRDGLGDVPRLAPEEARVRRALRQQLGGGGEGDGGGGGAALEDATAAASAPVVDGDCGGLAAAEAAAPAAAAALAAAARAYPGQLVLVALGPLSNVALALRREPQLPSLLRAVLVLGGGEGEYGGNVTPYAEFNFHADPEAAAEVIRGFGVGAGGSSSSSSSKSGARCTDVRKLLKADPRIALVTWRCCQRHLLPWEVVDRMTGAAATATASTAATATATTAADEDPVGRGASEAQPVARAGAGEAEAEAVEAAVEAAGASLRGRFLAGILAPFLERWRRESPEGMLLGDPLATALAAGMPPPPPPPPPRQQHPHQPQQQPPSKAPCSDPRVGTDGSPPPGDDGGGGGGGDDHGGGGGDGGGLAERPWGALVLDYYTAPCRVELRGERRGACVYGNAIAYDSSPSGQRPRTAEQERKPRGGDAAASSGGEAAAVGADRGEPVGCWREVDSGEADSFNGGTAAAAAAGPSDWGSGGAEGDGAVVAAAAASGDADADEGEGEGLEPGDDEMAVVAVIRSIDMAAVADMVIRTAAAAAPAAAVPGTGQVGSEAGPR